MSIANGESDVAAVLGGTIIERTKVENSTVEKARIDLGRFVAKGEWHRIEVERRLPWCDVAPYLDFSLRSAAVREVQMVVCFAAESAPRVMRFTHAYAADLPALIADPFGVESPEPARDIITPDAGLSSRHHLAIVSGAQWGRLMSDLLDGALILF